MPQKRDFAECLLLGNMHQNSARHLFSLVPRNFLKPFSDASAQHCIPSFASFVKDFLSSPFSVELPCTICAFTANALTPFGEKPRFTKSTQRSECFSKRSPQDGTSIVRHSKRFLWQGDPDMKVSRAVGRFPIRNCLPSF